MNEWERRNGLISFLRDDRNQVIRCTTISEGRQLKTLFRNFTAHTHMPTDKEIIICLDDRFKTLAQ